MNPRWFETLPCPQNLKLEDVWTSPRIPVKLRVKQIRISGIKEPEERTLDLPRITWNAGLVFLTNPAGALGHFISRISWNGQKVIESLTTFVDSGLSFVADVTTSLWIQTKQYNLWLNKLMVTFTVAEYEFTLWICESFPNQQKCSLKSQRHPQQRTWCQTVSKSD